MSLAVPGSSATLAGTADRTAVGPAFRDYEVLAYIDGDFEQPAAEGIPVLDKAADVPFGLAFARQVTSSEVHVNDGYARRGGVGQQRTFTRRQWIGIQTTDVPYPHGPNRDHPSKEKNKGENR